MHRRYLRIERAYSSRQGCLSTRPGDRNTSIPLSEWAAKMLPTMGLVKIGSPEWSMTTPLSAAAKTNQRRRRAQESRGGLCGADERFDHGAENNQAVGGVEGGFDGALGMRHKPGDVALAVADARDVGH